MGQAEIIIDMVQCQLLPQAVLALAERADAPSHRRHMLADGYSRWRERSLHLCCKTVRAVE